MWPTLLKGCPSLLYSIVASFWYVLGWWFVCTNEDSQGWAPATYLEPVATQDEEGGGEWVTMDESDSHGMAFYIFSSQLVKRT